MRSVSGYSVGKGEGAQLVGWGGVGGAELTPGSGADGVVLGAETVVQPHSHLNTLHAVA